MIRLEIGRRLRLGLFLRRLRIGLRLLLGWRRLGFDFLLGNFVGGLIGAALGLGDAKPVVVMGIWLGATAAFDVAQTENPVAAVRQLTEGARGADAVIEAVGRAQTWEWALQIVRKGGTVNLFGGCPSGTEVKIDPAALHYAEITIKSTFHHTPQFIREALETIARGEIRASDFVTGEVNLDELPKLFQDMKNRNGELKTAVIP